MRRLYKIKQENVEHIMKLKKKIEIRELKEDREIMQNSYKQRS